MTINQNLQQIIGRDVALCEAMADEMGDYLKSSELFWEPNRRRSGGADLPKLTLGGLLLAKRRLEAARDFLTADQSTTLTRAGRELDFHKSRWRIRYQNKLVRDLRSRLDAWTWYLDDCQGQGEAATAHYVRQVQVRVKIDLLLEEAADVGLEVGESRRRLRILDQRLRADFAPGVFCWLDPLAGGFPADRFWYLWGQWTNKPRR